MSYILWCVSVGKIGREAKVCEENSERGWAPPLMEEYQGLRAGGPQRVVPAPQHCLHLGTY